jgi:hypothetical protein
MKVVVRVSLFLMLLFTPALAAAPDGQEEICNTSAVFFCENWEARALGKNDLGRALYKSPGWSWSSGAGGIINTQAFDGTKSINLETPANSVSGFALDVGFTPRRTVYWRWYVKYSSNYVWSPVATKHNEIFINGSLSTGLFNSVSNTGFDTPVQTFADKTGCGSDCYFEQNIGQRIKFNRNQWYCVEVRMTMNTGATANDGYIQGWIDNVQKWEHPNVNLSAISSNQLFNGFFLASYWNCNENESCAQSVYQHPTINRYMDNLVGSTSRVGCLNAPADGVPPSSPGSVVVR